MKRAKYILIFFGPVALAGIYFFTDILYNNRENVSISKNVYHMAHQAEKETIHSHHFGNSLAQHSNLAQEFPLPTEYNLEQEENERMHAAREEYLNQLHKTAPGVDWRKINQENSEQLYVSQMNLRGSVDSFFNGKLKGYWQEKGSANNAGRTLFMDVDTVSNLLYVGSDQGNIWRGNPDGTGWKVLNDKLKFGGLRLVKVLQLPANKKRILAVTSNSKSYYSDDEGAHWNKSSGLSNIESWGNIEQAVVANDSQKTVYVLAHDWNYTTWNAQTSIFSSKNQGKTFTLENVFNEKIYGGTSRFSFWTPPYGSGKLYMIIGDSLFVRSDFLSSFNYINTLPVSYNGNSYLAGLENKSGTCLYAYVNDSLLYSNNGGNSWSFKSYVNKKPYNKSFYCDLSDPQNVYLGDVECWVSRDGGVNFNRVNKWGDYYGDKQNNLHADIQSIQAKYIKGGQEVIYVNTDGGMYYSNDALQSVQNLSMKNLNISQYYSVYTAKSDPKRVYAGAQDQGFQACQNDLGGALDFEQSISGDYGHLVSGDSGISVWSNYPGFTQYYRDIANNKNRSTWNFTCKGQVWIPPITADPDDASVCWLGGGSDNNAHAHLYKLTYNGSNKLVASEGTFDFERKQGDRISAIAFSPVDHQYQYVMTDQGLFWMSTDGGQSWDTTKQFVGPGANYLYGASILPSRKNKNIIYISGSGYSTSAFWVSTDNGKTFVPRVSGLPKTMMFEIVSDSKEEYIFAATDAGPYVYSISDSVWKYLGGAVAPDQTYWTVEFIDRTQTARFGTYGRGIWDFKLGDPTLGINLTTSAIVKPMNAYPNPTNQYINIEFESHIKQKGKIEIYDQSGRLQQQTEIEFNNGNNFYQVDISNLSSGIYYLLAKSQQQIQQSKFEVR